MKKLKVMTYGNPVLREKARPIYKIDDSLRELAGTMIETMHKEDGIGLAAPQIGKSIAMFVIDISPIQEDAFPMTFINPEILETHGSCPYKEGCLSVPGVSTEVIRPERIKMRYTDLSGKQHEGVADGILARVIQHEFDHLNGVLFVDHISDENRNEFQPVLQSLEKKNLKTKPGKTFKLALARLSKNGAS